MGGGGERWRDKGEIVAGFGRDVEREEEHGRDNDCEVEKLEGLVRGEGGVGIKEREYTGRETRGGGKRGGD